MRQSRPTSATPAATAFLALLICAVLGGSTVAAAAVETVPTSTLRYGTSAGGRPLVALHRSAAAATATTRLLVIGNMHGDERAGLDVGRRLRTLALPRGLDLWLIPSMNPDGTAMNRRTNARRVDLNRNFPDRWVRAGRGTVKWSGPRVASEPETRALMAFVRAHPPVTTVVFHQPLFGVDSYRAKSLPLVRALARAARLPIRSFACQGTCHGTFTGWHNRVLPGRAVTVEFGSTVSTRRLDTVAAAVLATATAH